MLKGHFKKTKGVFSKEKMKKPEVPEGLFRKCGSCGSMVLEEEFQKNDQCCPACGKHVRLDAWSRIEMTADKDSFFEWDKDLVTDNPLDFPEYDEKVTSLQKKTGLSDAVVTGKAKIYGNPVALGVMSSDFMMGSMGTVYGGKGHKRKITCNYFLLFRWSENAGRNLFSYADGKSISGIKTS